MFTIILFSSCDKHDTISNIGHNNPTLRPRTSSPGSYSVSDGMLVFPTVGDFNQTLNYIGESSDSIRRLWRDGLSITTTQKDYADFIDEFEAIGDDDPSAEEELEGNYDGKIRISVNEEDTTREYWAKFPVYNEFTNSNGLFRTGGTIIKVTENKVISLVFPNLIDLGTIDDDTEQDTSQGIYVFSLIPVPKDCHCPDAMKGRFHFNVGCGRRFVMNHELHPAVRFFKNGNQTVAYFDVYGFMRTEHNKRSCLGLWSGQRIASTLVYSQQGFLYIEELGQTYFFFGTSPSTITQHMAENMYNTLEGAANVGHLNVNTTDFDVQLCNDIIYARVSRDGWQNYFGLFDCD